MPIELYTNLAPTVAGDKTRARTSRERGDSLDGLIQVTRFARTFVPPTDQRAIPKRYEIMLGIMKIRTSTRIAAISSVLHNARVDERDGESSCDSTETNRVKR
jgi:hypothetical protein